MYKVILTTGGTGGHIFPALALAEQLRIKFPDVRILFIGSNYGPEKHLTEKAGVQFEGLNVRGILGRGLHAPKAFIQLAFAIPKAIRLIHNFQPNSIVGFGSYASFAPIVAAAFCKVPILLHEQNAIPGSSNRFLSKYAKKICISLPETTGFDNAKCIFTGNPVRKSIVNAKYDVSEIGNTKKLFILGGSQGAHAINSYIITILDKLKANGVEIIHQTGEKDWELITKEYEKHGYPVSCVRPFIDNIAEIYSWADIVIGRAGASTIAELCAAGLPAIFVPFPAAIHDHQTQNAKALENAGAARLVPQNKIEEVGDILLDLLDNPLKLQEMSKNALKLAKPDAAKEVADILEDIMLHK